MSFFSRLFCQFNPTQEKIMKSKFKTQQNILHQYCLFSSGYQDQIAQIIFFIYLQQEPKPKHYIGIVEDHNKFLESKNFPEINEKIFDLWKIEVCNIQKIQRKESTLNIIYEQNNKKKNLIVAFLVQNLAQQWKQQIQKCKNLDIKSKNYNVNPIILQSQSLTQPSIILSQTRTEIQNESSQSNAIEIKQKLSLECLQHSQQLKNDIMKILGKISIGSQIYEIDIDKDNLSIPSTIWSQLE